MSSVPRDLTAAWIAVRRQLFPRWDRPGKWRIRLSKNIGEAQGYCDKERKRVILSSVPEDSDERDLIIIHEICHALSRSNGHGSTWQGRMVKTRERVKQIGRARLVELLDYEVQGYDDDKAEDVTDEDIYDSIRDVLGYGPTLSFERVIFQVAWRHLAGMSVREFVRKYPKSRKVYEQAKRSAAEG
jgi:hypothetical protein